MAIIDYTYFVGDINLPTDNTNYRNKLNLYIDRAQKKYLTFALGYELYTLFIADLPTPIEQRFTDMLEGVEYTDSSGLLTKWDGLKNDEKDSFLAYFTAFAYSLNSQEYESGNGMKANMSENSDRVSPVQFQKTAYNLGVKNYQKFYDFLYENRENYPEWEPYYFRGLENINKYSL